MDPRERFSQAAEDYAKYRPDYPDALVRACAAYAGLIPGSAVVDIGCGTGISTRRFAAHGYRVTGIEPNAAMLAKARATPAPGPGQVRYIDGDADHTGLPDSCAELITCAQALHWFELNDCVAEWRRILSPQGACAAFWNYRQDDGWQTEYEALLLRWSSEYGDVRKAVDGGQDNSAWVKNSSQCIDVQEHEFENSQCLDWPALLGRANSSSYVIHGVKDRPGFEAALQDLFGKRQQNGIVEFKYRTYLLLWRFTP